MAERRSVERTDSWKMARTWMYMCMVYSHLHMYICMRRRLHHILLEDGTHHGRVCLRLTLDVVAQRDHRRHERQVGLVRLDTASAALSRAREDAAP